MTKWHKLLIGFAILWIGGAECLKYVPMIRLDSVVLGAIEVFLAVVTGGALGIITVKKH